MYFSGKKVLIVYDPHRAYKGSLLQMLVDAVKSTGLEVSYIDVTNKPKYQYKSIWDRVKNIYHRILHKNTQYILQLENEFHNKYYQRQVKNFKEINPGKFDYVLVIKPEEFTEITIKEISSLGVQTVGYIWDGLRLFMKNNLKRNVKYLDGIFSFDTNNIINHPDLNLKFCTNFAVLDKEIVPFNNRLTDVFFIGDLAGTLNSQRRDLKLEKFLKNIEGKLDINIFLGNSSFKISKLNTTKFKYLDQFISLEETKERTRNSKIVLDICKAHHIGLSFRFFECLASETKIITNNKDVKNYDFFNPNNIMVVDFDHNILDQNEFARFLETPYEKVPIEIIKKYSIDNWINYLFNIEPYINITK